jgi:imidazolonepropionase-like amidohydrolase
MIRPALAALMSAGFALSAAAAQDDVTAFRGVTVVPMDSERVLENHTVIVEGERISAVGPAAETAIPDGATVIEGEGRWLMPGLAEMHGHVPGPEQDGYAENVLFLYVSNGVTTVRNMAGHDSHPVLRDRVESGEITGPVLHIASPWLSPQNANDPEQGRETVRHYHEAGFDLLKMGNPPLGVYEAIAEEAHEVGIPFAGHIPHDVGLVGALDARQISIDHFDRYVEFMAAEADAGMTDPGFFGSGWIHLADRGRMAEAVERTIEAGTWNVPTLSLVEHLASDESAESMIEWPEMRYMPQNVRDGWVRSKNDFAARDDFQPDAARELVEIRRELLMALHEAGALIALGSDAPQFFNVPGFSIHHEMAMMAAAGMTPYEVLETGTRLPAEYFGTPEAFGTVEPGRRADLILLEADPLADLENVKARAGVMAAGRWLSEEDIQARLETIAANVAGE